MSLDVTMETQVLEMLYEVVCWLKHFISKLVERVSWGAESGRSCLSQAGPMLVAGLDWPRLVAHARLPQAAALL